MEDDSVLDVDPIHHFHLLLEVAHALLGAVCSVQADRSADRDVRANVVSMSAGIRCLELHSRSDHCGIRTPCLHIVICLGCLFVLVLPWHLPVLPEVLLQGGGVDGRFRRSRPLHRHDQRHRLAELVQRRHLQVLHLVLKGR